jgi:predicted metalloprotease with PDZ domain
LTEYYGSVLGARSGLWSVKEYREHLASVAASLDHRPGRKWRPLQDTADFAPQLYNAGFGGAWSSWRREVDFYDEGELIWLEADVLIRSQTGGKKSLDDFCKQFHGGRDGLAAVNPYTFDEVVKTMNAVSAHDWKAFFTERLTATGPHAPLGGITESGWKLEYTDKANEYIAASEASKKQIDLSYSLGLSLKEDGEVQDATPGMSAYEAGIGPGMKLVAVDGRRWTRKVMEEAIKRAKDGDPLALLVENGDYFKTLKLDYHDGPKYPHLVRDESKTDLLTEIITSRSQ